MNIGKTITELKLKVNKGIFSFWDSKTIRK